MKSSKFFKSAAAVTLALAMVAPTLATAPVSHAAKMSFNKKTANLVVGASQSVKVKNFKKGSKATWKSSNKKVATVSSKKATASIKAVGAGTAKITCVVKKGKKKTTVSGLTVKVRQAVSSVTIQQGGKNVTSLSLKPGEKVSLEAAINNKASGSSTNQTIKWASDNKKIASVAKKGTTKANLTAVANGTAKITVTVDGKVSTVTVTVKGAATATKDPGPTPWTYPDKKTIYKQHYDITRWYNPGTNQGHTYDGYKNNNFAIWMIGFFDNKYSTNESGINTFGGPGLKKYRDKPLNLKGEFKYEGKAQKTILLQINYTKPSDYPILWKWENGAKEDSDQTLNKVSGHGMKRDAVAPDKYEKIDLDFTIPKNAENGDKDDATGQNFDIYLYFPNKPGGALAYVKDNTFHFRNFWLSEK